jgi:hypothetical protein
MNSHLQAKPASDGKKYAGQSGIGDISGSTILAANTRGNEYSVNIRLDGVTEYELAEIFGKVIDNSAGVLEKHGCILRRAWVREKSAKAQLLHSFNKPPLNSVTISKI